MTDPTNPSIPAGWYPDPAGGPRPRWWDGTAWTDHYAEAPGQPSVPQAPAAPQSPAAGSGGYDPAQPFASDFGRGTGAGTGAPAYAAAAPYSADAGALTAPPGTPTGTPWIWLLVFLPLAALLPLLFVDWAGYAGAVMANPGDTTQADIALYTSPPMIAGIVLGLLLTPLSVLFAWLDWRALKNAGVPQPFHFVWVLFILVIGSSAVYTIGRAVVVKRRTGSGLAPMWWTIVVLVLSLVIGIAIAGIAIAAVIPPGALR